MGQFSCRKDNAAGPGNQCCGTVPFCLGSGSGSQIFYPRFRLRFRFLPSNFKLFFSIKTPAGYPDFCFFSRQLHACVGQCPVRVDLVWYFFLQQEPEPEPRARIWFQFVLGQNDTVPAAPVPDPVPQHCWQQLPLARLGSTYPAILRLCNTWSFFCPTLDVICRLQGLFFIWCLVLNFCSCQLA